MENAGFNLDIRSDGLAVITIDTPGESQNTLKVELIDQANAMFDQLEQDSRVKGLIFISAKPGSFIAGADINMIRNCESAEQATELAKTGQRFFARLENFKAPVIAAIDGVCLGGGLELALACHARVCTDSPKTALALPEVQLGVLPGSGGTQRLPRLIGIPAALDMMLTGRHVKPHRALKAGLVDDVVPESILLQAAVKLLARLQENRFIKRRSYSFWSLRGLSKLALEDNPLGRSVVFHKARDQVLAKTRGNYPAPNRIIECVEIGASQGFAKGLEAEARYFGELAVSSEARQLMAIYFATTALKRDNGVDDESIKPREIEHVGVLGAGLMGAGITYVTLNKAGLPVRLKDKDAEGINRGLQYIDRLIKQRRQRRSVTRFEAALERNRVTATLDFSGFQKMDLVIEAVFEDIDIKHQTVADVEKHCPERVIFATNTSSIPIGLIAEAARRPQQVVGMHYFSPVEKMPLLEVIATEKTAPEVIATAVALGRKQGKTVIVVKDGAGFYVNRMLAPYINEANHLLESGIAIDKIDGALTRFGFPVGPFQLLDEVGLDVVAKVAPILYQAFGERMKPSAAAEVMLADGRRGKKNKKGFYVYQNAKKGPKQVDESVYRLLGVMARLPLDDREIIERCVLPMINEAARCWDEGVIRNLRDGDVGAVFGIGFPPFRGGPFRYADSLGLKEVVAKLERYRRQHGERFAPAEILVKMAAEERLFHQH